MTLPFCAEVMRPGSSNPPWSGADEMDKKHPRLEPKRAAERAQSLKTRITTLRARYHPARVNPPFGGEVLRYTFEQFFSPN